MVWTKKRLAKELRIVRSLVPADEEIYEDEIAYGQCDNKRALFFPTDRRMIVSQPKFLWGRRINDFSWGKFKHLRMNEGWLSSTVELEYRNHNRILKLEGLDKEQIRNFYRRARGRITKYDNKYQISSRICPQCREIINFSAKQCPHCHSMMTVDADPL